MERPEPKPSRPNVLFISRKWPPAVGGMETYSVELCTELSRLTPLSKRVLQGRADGYPPRPAALLFFIVTTAFFLLTRSRDYDVVHFGDLVLFPLAWLHAQRHPASQRFITVHGLDLIYGNRRGLGPALYRRFLHWAHRRPAAVNLFIANSENTARLATDAGFDPVKAIPLGVRSQERPLCVHDPQYPPYVLFVGRLVPRKGAAWFARSVLPNLPPELKFRVIGKVWDPQEAALLSDNPRVELLGYVDQAELDRHRAGCLAIVMPNRTSPDLTDVEGFGIAALEAARDGIPILASAIEGIIDAIVNGTTGFLLPENDVHAWVTSLQRIQRWSPKQRRDYANTAAATVARRYTWLRVAQQTLAAYQAGRTS